MAKFMYLFRSTPTAYRSMSPEQMQQTMKSGWTAKMRWKRTATLNNWESGWMEQARLFGVKPKWSLTAPTSRRQNRGLCAANDHLTWINTAPATLRAKMSGDRMRRGFVRPGI
jgi:hypothetical protein